MAAIYVTEEAGAWDEQSWAELERAFNRSIYLAPRPKRAAQSAPAASRLRRLAGARSAYWLLLGVALLNWLLR
jgi:hypothetical protein